jgi:hypothetical protein
VTWKKLMASGVAIETGPSGLMLRVQTNKEEEKLYAAVGGLS